MPRAVLMMLIVLAVGQVIARIDYRFVLMVGAVLMAAGLALLTEIRTPGDLHWIVVGSTVQAVGAGLILMPLSTYSFATLPVEMRTDAAGLYSLVRQIGCASCLAVVSALLQSKIAAHLAELPAGAAAAAGVGLRDAATLRAYDDCFAMMAVSAGVMMPAILLFRSNRGAEPAAGAVPGD